MATQLPDGVRLLRTLTGHGGTIGRIGWSPDGRLLAAPSADGTVRIWGAASGECLRIIRGHHSAVLATAFDLDGSVLATGAGTAQSCGTSTVVSCVPPSTSVSATPSHSARASASWRPGTHGPTAEEWEVLLDLAVATILAHSVCFRETDPLTARSYLVFPELINLRKSVIADEQPIEEGAAYPVSGAVGNVYASLVVLLGYTSTFTRTNQGHDSLPAAS